MNSISYKHYLGTVLNCSELKQAGRAALCELLRRAGPICELLDSKEHCSTIQQIISEHGCTITQIDDRIKWLQSDDIAIVVIGDNEYPQCLAEIYDPPPVLYVRGNKKLLNNKQPRLAIVGSRRADLPGCDLAFQLGASLAAQGICVVSGLALGIDVRAHCGALDGDKAATTIAVMGHGLDTLYPTRHRKIAERIVAQGGAIVSQFAPGTPPYPANFLNRNRVIAGLCCGSIVVQATERSGSLSTARHALEEGREVLVVPGDVKDPRYAGSNKLLRDGAHLVRHADDVLDVFPEYTNRAQSAGDQANNTTLELTAIEKQIVGFIKNERCVAYELVVQQLNNSPESHYAICELELKGVIQRLPGNQIAMR
jgi:DNA processing protein